MSEDWAERRGSNVLGAGVTQLQAPNSNNRNKRRQAQSMSEDWAERRGRIVLGAGVAQLQAPDRTEHIHGQGSACVRVGQQEACLKTNSTHGCAPALSSLPQLQPALDTACCNDSTVSRAEVSKPQTPKTHLFKVPQHALSRPKVDTAALRQQQQVIKHPKDAAARLVDAADHRVARRGEVLQGANHLQDTREQQLSVTAVSCRQDRGCLNWSQQGALWLPSTTKQDTRCPATHRSLRAHACPS
jgi:hypothetical protein